MSDQAIFVENILPAAKMGIEGRTAALFAAIFQAAPNGLIIFDYNSRQIVDANPMAAKSLGLSMDEILGKPIHVTMHEGHQEACPFHEDRPVNASGLLNLRKSADSEMPVMFSTTCLDGEYEALLEAIKEIEEDEDLDFILEDSDNVMKESMEGAHRVGEIVQNLKSFAREDGDARVPANINEGIESMIKMVWNELKYKCTVEKNFTQVPVVQCHKGQINQVIMNMLVNASHAMPDSGGVITVSTGVKDGMLEVKIADNGSGIPLDVLPRIFDPFYTTKDVGKGTGLGLSISHGIILDHEGRIEVTSEVGVGTEFRIYLPLADCETEDLIG